MLAVKSSRYIAIQNGARRGYAVPAILEGAGLLERFYTDICGNVGNGKALSVLAKLPGAPSLLKKLARRRVPDAIVDKSQTFVSTFLRSRLRAAIAGRDPAARYRAHLQWDTDFGNAMITEGFGKATHVFSMLSEGAPFLGEARRRGLKIITEVYILLSTEAVLQEERQRFPEWELEHYDLEVVRREFYGETKPIVGPGDYAVCPSEAVQADLVAHWGVPANHTTVVPYGMDPRWLDLVATPVRGRMLFVGTAELRKGIHYLGMAAQKLKARWPHLEFRVAGNVSDVVRRHPVCRELTFLGRVPRDRIHEEFQAADVFVLPSLAEGSAEVTYEALGAGVPVVTTRAAGSVVRDGIEGRILPERDPDALVEALAAIMCERSVRDRMAVAARERARDYTWDRYGERLTEALKGWAV